MLLLILGLTIFLGVHSVRVLAGDWRQGMIEQRGEAAFKGLYAVLSLLGLVLLIVGYGQTRTNPQHIWFPPAAMAHIAALLMLAAFVLLAATYIPGNRLKAVVGHPMVLGVKVWAFSHLLANGRLGDMVLFGTFLLWAVLTYVKSKKIDRQQGIVRSSEHSIARDSMTVAVGIGAWFFFVLWAHLKLVGVVPFG